MSLERTISAVITFGVFRLDVEKSVLERFGTTLHLAPQPFQLLVMLASRPGEVVTRDEIQAQLWGPNTFVDFERGLNHCVRQIRAVLGDDPAAPTYIETIPRSGYRFVAPVTVIPPPPSPEEILAESAHKSSQPASADAKPAPRSWRRPAVS